MYSGKSRNILYRLKILLTQLGLSLYFTIVWIFSANTDGQKAGYATGVVEPSRGSGPARASCKGHDTLMTRAGNS